MTDNARACDCAQCRVQYRTSFQDIARLREIAKDVAKDNSIFYLQEITAILTRLHDAKHTRDVAQELTKKIVDSLESDSIYF